MIPDCEEMTCGDISPDKAPKVGTGLFVVLVVAMMLCFVGCWVLFAMATPQEQGEVDE